MSLKSIIRHIFKPKKQQPITVKKHGMEEWEIAAAILDNRICKTCRKYITHYVTDTGTIVAGYSTCRFNETITCKKWELKDPSITYGVSTPI